MAYDLVTAGILARRDPELMRLLAASAGYTSIMGRGGDELEALDRLAIMGADGDPANNPLMAQVIAQKLAQGSLLTRDAHPSKARDYVLGINSVAAIAAGAPGTAVSFPQIVFRPERFVVPSDIAGQFLISQIIIGKMGALDPRSRVR